MKLTKWNKSHSDEMHMRAHSQMITDSQRTTSQTTEGRTEGIRSGTYKHASVTLKRQNRNLRWAWTIWATSRETLFMLYANNKGADQPAHPRSLISVIVIRSLDSIILLLSNFKNLSSLCSWAGRFESYQVANPEDRFYRYMAQFA